MLEIHSAQWLRKQSMVISGCLGESLTKEKIDPFRHHRIANLTVVIQTVSDWTADESTHANVVGTGWLHQLIAIVTTVHISMHVTTRERANVSLGGLKRGLVPCLRSKTPATMT